MLGIGNTTPINYVGAEDLNSRPHAVWQALCPLSQLPGPEKSYFCVQLFAYLEFLVFLILRLLIK